MTVREIPTGSYFETLRDDIRAVRNAYDKLDRGASAALRRCRTANEVALEGVYWNIGGELTRQHRDLAHVVLLFPAAQHAQQERFAFGSYLRAQLGESSSAPLRFRRVLDSRDRDELSHQLRRLLNFAASDGAGVNWGFLGRDILHFFAESDAVRRRWAQDFYAPPRPTPIEPTTGKR